MKKHSMWIIFAAIILGEILFYLFFVSPPGARVFSLSQEIENARKRLNGYVKKGRNIPTMATLKRIEQRPGLVVLHPANATLAPLEYAPERVRVQGVLVGQMRAYR